MNKKRYYVNCASYLCDKDLNNTLSIFECADLLNESDKQLMNCRAKNTNLKLVLKDIIDDLKKMDTYKFAEHIEKITNLEFSNIGDEIK